MKKLVYGARRDKETGKIELYLNGRNFEAGSFAYMNYIEIATGSLRSIAGKKKKAEEIISEMENQDSFYY